MHNFSPAFTGSILYGASRPGFPSERVHESAITAWCCYMQLQGIEKVICLLTNKDISKFYDINLLACYGKAFKKVHHFPIEDFRKIPASTMTEILACIGPEKTVVHCSAGMGRTGQVIYAALLREGFPPDKAMTQCFAGGRNPVEYTHYGQ